MTSKRANSNVREFFEDGDARWERRYQGGGVEAATYYDREQAALALASRFLADGANIVEFGCGTGELSRQLEEGGHVVIPCDIALRMAKQADEQVQRGSAMVADIEAPPFKDESFDAVVLIGVVSYIDDPLPMLAGLRRLLKPGGFLIISSANRKLLLNGISRRLERRATAAAPKDASQEGADKRRSDFFREVCQYYKASDFNRLVPQAGFRLVASRNIGFGSLRLPGMPAMSDQGQVRIARALTAISRVWPFRRLGDFAFANVACFRRDG